MADSVRIVRDAEYEEMGMAYQCALIAILERSLKRSGLGPDKVKQAVKRFVFELGDFHDQGWLKVEGERVYPLLCFSRMFLNIDTDISELGTLYAPSTGFAAHEVAMGNVEAYFEGDERTRVETGSFGEPGDE